MAQEQDEHKIIQAAQRGDLNAFNELVLQYQSQVYNLAYRIMGDGDSAADATQEAFISAYRALDGYRGDACVLQELALGSEPVHIPVGFCPALSCSGCRVWLIDPAELDLGVGL